MAEDPLKLGIVCYPTIGGSGVIATEVARHAATNGEDLRYVTDPEGHHCLEDSSCSFLTPE